MLQMGYFLSREVLKLRKLALLSVAAVAFAATAIGAGKASAMVYIDMTAGVWAGIGTDTATTLAPLPLVGTVTATATPAGSLITQTGYDGGAPPAFVPPLAGTFDGFGIGTDEITEGGPPGESITVSWNGTAVSIVDIFILDLFAGTSTDPVAEVVEIEFNGNGTIKAFTAVGPNPGSGELTISAAALSAAGLTPTGVTSIKFTAPGIGASPPQDNDYAVAGIHVVPIPGAVWLFGSGVLGLLGIGYSRRRKAAA